MSGIATRPSRLVMPNYGAARLRNDLGLTGVWTGTSYGRVWITQEATTTANSPGSAQGRFGQAAAFNSGGYAYVRLAADADTLFTSTTDCTIIILHRYRDTTARTGGIFGYGLGNVQVNVRNGVAGQIFWDYGNETDSSGNGRLIVSGYTKTTNWEVLTVVAGGGRGREAYRNGQQIGADATRTASRTSTTHFAHIGCSWEASTPTDNLDVGLVAVVGGRAWTQAEIADRCASPEALLRSLFIPVARRIWVPVSGSGAQTIAIGQAAETDAAQALTADLLLSIAQVVAHETAQALQVDQSTAIGQVVENHTAQDIGADLSRAVGQVAETDTAQALAVGQSKTIGQVTEVHTAQAFDADLVRAITIVAETDTAQAVQARLTLAVGQVAETDTAQAVSAAAPNLIVQVSETDIAQTIQADVTLAIGQVAETHLAQVLQVDLTKAIGQVNETDTAQAVQVDLTRAIGQVNETDTAQTLLPVQPSTFAQVVEVHTAQALFADQLLGIGRATQTDTAQAMVVLQTRAITLALEIDLSQPLQADLTKAIGQVNETDLASAFLVVLGGEGQHIISPRLYLVPDENRVYLVPDRDGTYSV